MRKILSKVMLGALLVAIAYIFYLMLIHPYWVQPKKDIEFLESKPTKEQILKTFGPPTEKIGSGETFQMTGWHPLPKEQAEGEAMVFQRPNADKIYIFFTTEGTVSFYVVSHS